MALPTPPHLDSEPGPSDLRDWIAARRDRWIGKLRDRGIGDPVREALLAVPRDDYAVTYHRALNPAGGPHSRQRNPRAWLSGLYGLEPLTFMPPPGGEHTITEPLLTIATMLDVLGATRGDRVLQLGTGTGYTAALLHHLTQGSLVISAEPDPSWARHARATLGDRAHITQPRTWSLDGADDNEHGFDRIVIWHDITCSPPGLRDILALDLPHACGRHPVRKLVTVVAGVVTALTFDSDGVTGTFHGIAQPAPARGTTATATATAGSPPSRRDGQRRRFLPDHLDVPAFRLLLHLAFPSLRAEQNPDRVTVTVTDPESGSHVDLRRDDFRLDQHRLDDSPYTAVKHRGDRPLWTEITMLKQKWADLGGFPLSQLKLERRGDEQVITLGDHELHRRPLTYSTTTPARVSSLTMPGTRHAS